ncbi:MAG TPA: serine/threonine-protein kinase [Ktedonobacterales bacterium]
MLICQFCGEKNPVGASFCDGCGGALNSAAAAQASAHAKAQVAQATAQQKAVRARQAPPTPYGTGRLPPRTLLGKRYLVLKNVGQGGMAAVYQATDTRANRVVAVKEMSQEGLSPEELKEALESFAAEAKLLKSLNHENLPKVYDSFSENARHYLVMEFIEGQTLEQRLTATHGPAPEADALRWAAQLCAVLHYMHTRKPPIIFRDLKPANIMLTPQGKIKLIDFGIARIFTPNRRRDTQALGTPGYAPPEQYGSAQTDARADVYALGATLYQLLTAYDVAKTPFALPSMQTRNPAISPHVRLAVERATRLDRNQRYESIAAFQRDLLSPTGMYLQSGAMAQTPADALRLLASQPAEGAEALYAGRVADWMTRWRRADLADAARRAVNTHSDRAAGLRSFLATAQGGGAARSTAGPKANTPPGGRASRQGQPGASGGMPPLVGKVGNALAAGAIAAVTTGMSGRAKGQAGAGDAIKAAMKAAATTFASTASSVTLPSVQPRELDLGRVLAGQDATGTLTVSGQGNAVSGSVRALSPWIIVDKQHFGAASTLITVTARTSAISGFGAQRGMIEISVSTQRVYIPVKVDVAAPPRPIINIVPPPPRATAAPASPAARFPGARPVGRNPAQPVLKRRALASSGAEGVRFALSVIVALALALSLAWGLPIALGMWASTVVQSAATRAMVFLLVAACAAAGGALAPYLGGARSPGRGRTAAAGAIVGGALALNLSVPFLQSPTIAASVIFPEAQQVGAVALTLPIMVALGAAIGAQRWVSRALLVVARAISAHPGLVLVASAALGGWAGLTLTQASLSAAFHQASPLIGVFSGCGAIIGIALGLALSATVGALTRRFATVAP